MPKKTLKRQRKQRGGGPETEIQEKIRLDLTRILEIFTLFPYIRVRYTQKHMADYTSEGAKLIFALRDIYSSKSGIKAPVRNELVARIIKLIINESTTEQAQGFGNPVREGIGYNIRSPIIIPQEGVSLLALTVPSVILHYGAKCIGAFCHALSQITDEEAFNNLHTITERINTILTENEANKERIEKFNNIKLWFDNKERRDSDGNVFDAGYVADKLIKNMQNIEYISNSDMKKYKPGLTKSIQNLNLLFFISNYFYDTLYYIAPQTFEYNDNYINNLFDALQKKDNEENSTQTEVINAEAIKKRNDINAEAIKKRENINAEANEDQTDEDQERKKLEYKNFEGDEYEKFEGDERKKRKELRTQKRAAELAAQKPTVNPNADQYSGLAAANSANPNCLEYACKIVNGTWECACAIGGMIIGSGHTRKTRLYKHKKFQNKTITNNKTHKNKSKIIK